MPRSRTLWTSLALCLSLTTLAGCNGLNLNSAQVQQLVQQAAVVLKALDDSGATISYDPESILKLTVDGKEITPTFDDKGRLLLNVKPGEEKQVELELKDGQKVSMPLRAEKSDFAGGLPEFEAFLMPGSERQLYGEVRRAGQGGDFREVFRAKAVKIELGADKVTNDNVRHLYAGSFKLPRQAFFVDKGDLYLHPSALWVFQQARQAANGPMGPAAGGQPGMQPQPGQQPGQPSGPGAGQGAPAPQFTVLQAPPPGGNPPPPGGMQPPPGGNPPPSGGMQPQPGRQPGMGPQPGPGASGPLKLHLLAELEPGKFLVIGIEAQKTPNAPPLPRPGERPVFVAEKANGLGKADLKISETTITDLAKFESEVIKLRRDGKFLPPPPPNHGPGGQPGPQPGGQPRPQPGGPQPGGQPGPQPGGPQPGGQPGPQPGGPAPGGTQPPPPPPGGTQPPQR